MKTVVLSLGFNGYQARNGLAPLTCANNDAVSLFAFFRGLPGVEAFHYPPEHADSDGALLWIKEKVASLGTGDLVIDEQLTEQMHAYLKKYSKRLYAEERMRPATKQSG